MIMKTRNVLGQKTRITVTKTRPANTTAYGAEDVVSENASSGTAWTFDAIVHSAGGSGTITGAVLVDDDTGRTQAMTLYLFDITPTGNLNDNLANTNPVAADTDNYLGRIEFPALSDNGGLSDTRASHGIANGLPLAVKAASGDDAIYGVLVTEGAFTPSSGEIFLISLLVDQD